MARRHLTFPSATFVTHDPADADVVDLYLMSLCRHHVLANSTFSFWAAWTRRSSHWPPLDS